MSIIEKYNRRVEKTDSLLCVGLDADVEKMPERFRNMEYPQFAFNKWIIEETHEYAAAYKPNSAFYEARGDAGLRELKMTMEYVTTEHPTIFTVLDAKRADIGNTNRGYVEAVFDRLGFDAITLHPYLGEEALAPFFERADKCSIVLVKTSNPGSGELQDLIVAEEGKTRPLWEHLAVRVAHVWNKNNNLMMVVGATYPAVLQKVREIAGEMPLLVPGVGAQGGSIAETVTAGQNAGGSGLIINSSRGILFSVDPHGEAKKLRDEINRYRKQV